jgi:hypothetical protein
MFQGKLNSTANTAFRGVRRKMHFFNKLIKTNIPSRIKKTGLKTFEAA